MYFLDTWKTKARYYLCIKAIRSAARPEPSQITTGTGGSSVTYSKTARIVFVPPSITKATTGMLLCVSESNNNESEILKNYRNSAPIDLCNTHMVAILNLKCISLIFYEEQFLHHTERQYHCLLIRSKHVDYLIRCI